jgi:hypothetical protein
MAEGSVVYTRRERIFMRMVGRPRTIPWFFIASGTAAFVYGLNGIVVELMGGAEATHWPFVWGVFIAQYGLLLLLGRHFVERRGLLGVARWS